MEGLLWDPPPITRLVRGCLLRNGTVVLLMGNGEGSPDVQVVLALLAVQPLAQRHAKVGLVAGNPRRLAQLAFTTVRIRQEKPVNIMAKKGFLLHVLQGVLIPAPHGLRKLSADKMESV